MEQNYNEIYQGLKSLITANNHTVYFESMINLTKIASSLNDLEQSITVFIKLEREFKLHLTQKYNKDYISIFTELQNKLFELVKQLQGNLYPLSNIFYLYEISSNIPNLTKSTQLDFGINQLKQQYDKLEYSGQAQMYINDIICIADILNSKKTCFREYFQRLFVMHVANIVQLKYDKIVENLIDYYDLDIEFITHILKDLLNKHSYFKLTPTERRSIYNWHLHILYNIPKYHNNTKWNVLYPIWKNLLFKHLENKQLDEGMYLHFFIYHMMSNTFHTQDEFKQFNGEIDIPASKFYKTYTKNNKLKNAKEKINKKEKIKITLLKDRIAKTSITQVELSMFKQLLQNQEFNKHYELSIFSCNYFEKSEDNPIIIKEFEDLGIKVHNPNSHIKHKKGFYHNHLEDTIRLRDAIIKNNTDILISGTNNYPAVDFILVNRTAPKQVFWSHGNFQYNLQEIDYFVSHIYNEDFNESIYLKVPVSLNIEQSYDHERIDKEKEKYPENTIILGTIGRLIKIDNDDYVEVICKLMEQYNNIIYLACGIGNIDNIRQKIKKYNLSDRWFFPGKVDPDIYGHIIDICPNTFPNPQGLSLLEMMAKGKAFVSLATPMINPALEKDLKLLTEEDLIKKYPPDVIFQSFPQMAFSIKTYEKQLLQLIENKNLRIQFGEEAKKFVYKKYMNDNINDFIDTLDEIIKDD